MKMAINVCEDEEDVHETRLQRVSSPAISKVTFTLDHDLSGMKEIQQKHGYKYRT